MVVKLRRSAGSFDPEGGRAVDSWRADDLAAMVQALGGRWLFVTLTVNRALFVGPEACYQRCNEYVRKVLAAMSPRGVFVSAFEVQTKTGDGWPHWHGLLWCPDARSLEAVKAAGVRAWRTRTESTDPETGEVTRSSELIGWVDVQAARDRKAVGIYVSKYLTKPWRVLPPWMLDSPTRFRKLRFSGRSYDVLERLYRHERQRGGRRLARPARIGRGRTLLQRMASSGSAAQVFRVERWGKLVYAGTIPVARDRWAAAVDEGRMRPVRLGAFKSMIVEVSPAFVDLVRGRENVKWRADARRFEAERAEEIRSAWRRRHEVPDDLADSAVAGAAPSVQPV